MFWRAGDSFGLAEAGVGGFENTDTQQCSTFYGAGCALYRDLFLDLDSLGAPPSPPPPPLTPLDQMDELSPIRIFFSQGLSSNMDPVSNLQGDSGEPNAVDPGLRRALDETEIIDGIDDPNVLAACTVGTTNTLCETNGRENAVRRAHPVDSAALAQLSSARTVDDLRLRANAHAAGGADRRLWPRLRPSRTAFAYTTDTIPATAAATTLAQLATHISATTLAATAALPRE